MEKDLVIVGEGDGDDDRAGSGEEAGAEEIADGPGRVGGEGR